MKKVLRLFICWYFFVFFNLFPGYKIIRQKKCVPKSAVYDKLSETKKNCDKDMFCFAIYSHTCGIGYKFTTCYEDEIQESKVGEKCFFRKGSSIVVHYCIFKYI